MILKKRYDNIMENIKVTEEMQDRVIKKINNLDFDSMPKKVMNFSKLKKNISIAACFVFLVVSVVIIPNIIKSNLEPPIQVVPDIVEYNSAVELSEAVGFKVYEMNNLPFEVEHITYTSYWKEIAEIEYANQEDTILYRKSVGNEDNSGDYNNYDTIKETLLNNCEVTIKGNGNKYNLAIWGKDKYTYSLKFSVGISETEILQMVKMWQ